MEEELRGLAYLVYVKWANQLSGVLLAHCLSRVPAIGKAWGSIFQWFVLPQSMWHYLFSMVFCGEFKVATRIWHFTLSWKMFSNKDLKCHIQQISEEFEDHNWLNISEADNFVLTLYSVTSFVLYQLKTCIYLLSSDFTLKTHIGG